MKAYRFVHLNVHSHYSIMDGCASIRELVDAAIKNGMPGMAVTDNGGMFGIMEFFDYVSRVNIEIQKFGKKPFKPIIGCELYVAKPDSKDQKDLHKDSNGCHLTVLAKNLTGYKNLIKIVSNSWTENSTMDPLTNRMDLEKYHEGLIVLSGNVDSEVFTEIVNNDMAGLDETIQWYKQTFADDYYLELQRNVGCDEKNNMPSDLMLEQQKVNAVLIQKAKENGIKVVATNDVHYLLPKHLEAHIILQCNAAGKTIDEFSTRRTNDTRWLRSRKEMRKLFEDVPEAVASTMEIFDKVEFYDIHHVPVVPSIDIPDGYGDDKKVKEYNYLEHLSFSKANQIYGDVLSIEVAERLKFELQIIKERGTSGYFLFLQDVVNTAQSELGVWFGPGRGRNAGSLVCYCLGITKIDPLKYGLSFERLICSEDPMPLDIEFDVDNEGRERIVEWLQQKYGIEHCAHVVSFCKYDTASPFWRNTVLYHKICALGVDAFGFTVSNEPISNLVPLSVYCYKDSRGNDVALRCVQYEISRMASSGLLNIDFYWRDELSQMRDICKLIKTRKDMNFNIEKIPVDDEKTMQLFQTAQTDMHLYDEITMKKFLQDFQLTCFGDLTILTTLFSKFRLESIDFIPDLIKHKKSPKAIKYIIPCMERYLHETYGYIVYWEQILLLSRLIAGFTRSESALLIDSIKNRKCDVLSVMKSKFIEGGMKFGNRKKVLEKVWHELETVRALSKPHVVCYTWMFYQMAYLKANYPEEYNLVVGKKDIY